MKKIKKITYWLTTLFLLTPMFVSAANIIPENPTGTSGLGGSIPGTTQSQFTGEIGRIINIVLGATALIAVAFIIYGGFQYMTSGINEELAEQGKKTLQNAIIGLIVVILSYVIVVVITRALIFGTGGV